MSLDFNKPENPNTPDNSQSEITKTPTISKKTNDKNAIIVMGAGIILLIIFGILYKMGVFSSEGSPSNATVKASSNAPITSPLTPAPNNSAQKPVATVVPKVSDVPVHALQNPFAGPYTLVGVVINTTGRNIAILMNGTKKIIVPEKGIVDDSWIVQSIQIDRVTLSFQDKTQVLTLQ